MSLIEIDNVGFLPRNGIIKSSPASGTRRITTIMTTRTTMVPNNNSTTSMSSTTSSSTSRISAGGSTIVELQRLLKEIQDQSSFISSRTPLSSHDQSNRRRVVSFQTVQIREYEYEYRHEFPYYDLAWDHIKEREMSLEEFEREKLKGIGIYVDSNGEHQVHYYNWSQKDRPRLLKNLGNFFILPYKREQIWKFVGMTENEIERAKKEDLAKPENRVDPYLARARTEKKKKVEAYWNTIIEKFGNDAVARLTKEVFSIRAYHEKEEDKEEKTIICHEIMDWTPYNGMDWTPYNDEQDKEKISTLSYLVNDEEDGMITNKRKFQMDWIPYNDEQNKEQVSTLSYDAKDQEEGTIARKRKFRSDDDDDEEEEEEEEDDDDDDFDDYKPLRRRRRI
jgi:hypothetical protein